VSPVGDKGVTAFTRLARASRIDAHRLAARLKLPAPKRAEALALLLKQSEEFMAKVTSAFEAKTAKRSRAQCSGTSRRSDPQNGKAAPSRRRARNSRSASPAPASSSIDEKHTVAHELDRSASPPLQLLDVQLLPALTVAAPAPSAAASDATLPPLPAAVPFFGAASIPPTRVMRHHQPHALLSLLSRDDW